MLKSSSENANNYRQESHTTKKNNTIMMIPLTDENVELYVHTFFTVSPRHSTGTAPAGEWLEFLQLYNEREGHYILSRQQMEAIEPYCAMNRDVEMTPDDFIRLIYLIRHEKLPQSEEVITTSRSVTSSTTKSLLDSRPRSSKLIAKKYYDVDSLSYKSKRRYSTNHPGFDDDNDEYHRRRFEGDDDSINHPGPNTVMNHPDLIYDNDRRSDYDNNNNNNTTTMNNNNENIHYLESDKDGENDTMLNLLKREKTASRKLKEYETRISNMSKEHLERIHQLQIKLDHMNIEAEQQKIQLRQQKHKERERLDKIAELQAIIADADSKNSLTLKKHEKRSEELENIRDKLVSMEETQNITENKLHDLENELFQAREVIRVLEKEKADLHMQMDAEKRLLTEARQDLEEQQNENTKLLEIIDKQKFDLDEARSGLRYYTSSPALDKKSLNINNNTEESSFAQEQIETEYLEKIALIEKERDGYLKTLKQNEQNYEKEREEYQTKLSNTENMLNESVSIQADQQFTINQLSLQFDTQHKVMDSIKSTIMLRNKNTPTGKLTHLFTIIAWIFLLYHMLVFAFSTAFLGSSNILLVSPKLFISRLLNDWVRNT